MRIVPRVVFGTLAASAMAVVPVVAISCGDEPGCKGPGCTQVQATVAAQCFDGSPNCVHSPPPNGVAAVAFQCFDGSTNPQCPHGVADAAFQDADAADARDVEAG
jgi:hypothetical protein